MKERGVSKQDIKVIKGHLLVPKNKAQLSNSYNFITLHYIFFMLP